MPIYKPLLPAFPGPGSKNINTRIKTLICGLEVVNHLPMEDIPFRLPARGAISPFQKIHPSLPSSK